MPLSKNTEKYIRSLSQKKFRQQHHRFVGEGEKVVREILVNVPTKVEILLATQAWWTKNERTYDLENVRVEVVTEKELKKVSQLKTPNQVLAVVEKIAYQIDQPQLANNWSIYLDRIQDPGNMGTIIRIADWFGIAHLFCSPDSADIYNPKVVQSTMGAFLRVPIIAIALEELTQMTPDLPTYAAVLGANSIYQQDFPKAGILVMGNESQGIAPTQLAKIDHQISIPSYGNSEMESLNVGVATAVICGEIRRGGC